MISLEPILVILVAVFAMGIGACMLFSDARHLLRIPLVSSLLALVVFVPLTGPLLSEGTRIFGFSRQFLVDPLALFHIYLVNVLFFVASAYAIGYFSRAIRNGSVGTVYVRRYGMLWQGFQCILLIVLVSNNIGLLWVALEATTLISAFLILSDAEALSIEAMWKYLLVCSVGIAFAFIGTILITAASRNLTGTNSLYLWSDLRDSAALLDPKITLMAFIFILVGFGTKAGLAPMHTWLPDAHSQSPTPVSAVFSGVMLNCALYCIMRYLPIAETALGGTGQARQLVLIFGLVSLIVAAVYIPTQHDIKRLLAYSSVEHIGIIAVGLGIGGLGTFACLLHTLNHSLSKMLAFFSAGHIGQAYGTRDMRRIQGASFRTPLWGKGFFIAVLSLIGVAPFSIFMSEFLILTAAFGKRHYVVIGLFLFSVVIVFVSALRHALGVSMGDGGPVSPEKGKERFIDKAIVVAIFACLLLPGLWIPTWLSRFLNSAAAVVDLHLP